MSAQTHPNSCLQARFVAQYLQNLRFELAVGDINISILLNSLTWVLLLLPPMVVIIQEKKNSISLE